MLIFKHPRNSLIEYFYLNFGLFYSLHFVCLFTKRPKIIICAYFFLNTLQNCTEVKKHISHQTSSFNPRFLNNY